MIVTFSLRSSNELSAISLWIAQDDPVRALSYVRELRSACRDIGEHPWLYPLVNGSRTLHKKLFSPYLIFYRIRRGEVVIVSIRHRARDNSRLR